MRHRHPFANPKAGHVALGVVPDKVVARPTPLMQAPRELDLRRVKTDDVGPGRVMRDRSTIASHAQAGMPESIVGVRPREVIPAVENLIVTPEKLVMPPEKLGVSPEKVVVLPPKLAARRRKGGVGTAKVVAHRAKL